MRSVRPILGLLCCAAAALSVVHCSGPRDTGDSLFCFGNGLCVRADGELVYEDGRRYCEVQGTCENGGDQDSDDDGGRSGGSGGGGSGGIGDDGIPVDGPGSVTDLFGDGFQQCDCDKAGSDRDQDGISDACEDRNHDGTHQASELNPDALDSDGDGLDDSLEDTNGNGCYDLGETSAVRADTDGDGMDDGDEDANRDGRVTAWIDANGDGCYDVGIDTPGESDPRRIDTDRDGVPDDMEDTNHNGSFDSGETYVFNSDTDCDGLRDGVEDRNHDGLVSSGETDPRETDSDSDGIPDGVEDANKNGRWDESTETHPLFVDTDGDGIEDGVEVGSNGTYDGFVDANSNGCWDRGEAGESDPRKRDTDNDGISDGVEDADHNGACETTNLPDPRHPGQLRVVLIETCSFFDDSDCDGLADGLEDGNHNASVDAQETNPRMADTDFDGLNDGCRGTQAQLGYCEDRNGNGVQDTNETDPFLEDTDGDGLSDGCEVYFDVDPTTGSCVHTPCGINPLLLDSDNDGADDGDEDANHNCRVDTGETDPRVAEEPPAVNTQERAEWAVCAARNLKGLTFATAQRRTHDYRLAFEVEKDAEEQESVYHIQAFGGDTSTDADGFHPNDTDDTLYGHVFQSGPGVVHDTAQTDVVLNRDIYGFVVAVESSAGLDDLLDDLRADLMASSQMTSQEEGSLTARPAHDDRGTDFPVLRAQRQYALQRYVPSAAYSMRNDILDMLLARYYNTTHSAVDYEIANIDQDFVHGTVCPGTRCVSEFTVYVSAVKRGTQVGPNGAPVVLITVALTQNDADLTDPQLAANRWYADRVTRLEDLTGGSAISRYGAQTGKACENKPRTLAKADLLWVLDDSGSMQVLLRRLQQASADAQAVLSSNANIVDFRVGMTTTNPSISARTKCPDNCDSACNGSGCPANCPDKHMGCIDMNGLSTDAQKIAAIVHDVDVFNNVNALPLPGGGGTFYYEDAGLLDCNDDASNNLSQLGAINNCASLSSFAPFFPVSHPLNVSPNYALRSHIGFLGSASTTGCTTATLDLSDIPQNSGTPSASCQRLTLASSCSDGPTVLSSQICDLMRAMGGIPNQSGSSIGGRRAHSGPETGSRSARRLISTLLPRVLEQSPQADQFQTKLRCVPNGTTCANASTCGSGEECVSGSCCKPVPLVTVFLSDEEDYWFKDDCSAVDSNIGGADYLSLPSLCYHTSGSPNTGVACTRAYCEAEGYIPPRCDDPLTCARPETVTDAPTGFNIDQHGWLSIFSISMKMRSGYAAQCDMASNPKACATEPCAGLDATQCSAAASSRGCIYSSSECKHTCATYSNSQESACRSNSQCRWLQSRKDADLQACIPAIPFNDCQACKRFRRLDESLHGGDLADVLDQSSVWHNGASQVALPGFLDVGPVYAITRNKGQEGSAGDTCAGGSSTYARGDGVSYRDMSIQTFGRTQDICASNYRSFMELLIADIVALSAPYKLLGSPIASTIKVGLARNNGDGTYGFAEVPRSRTQGFIYDATTNSIGFKSDPITGQCGNNGGSCTQAEEIAYARTAAHVPREGDIVYISYRLWKAVPCDGECADDEVCASVTCTEASGAVSCDDGSACPPGYTCNGNHTCDRNCTLGDVVLGCVSQPSCGACETYDLTQKACVSSGDSCDCSAANVQRCDPDEPQSCAVGQTCVGCTCQTITSCLGSIGAYGYVDSCTDALNCCRAAQAQQDRCEEMADQQACQAQNGCRWTVSNGCMSNEPTCCGTDETTMCYRDPETQKNALYCKASCECEGRSCANDPSVCESWQTCDSQTQMCTPACHPTQQFCCEDCGCECRQVPN